MAPIPIPTLLSLFLLLPFSLAHMYMSEPSPLRDPHSDRDDEPKDWNILTPLASDGSNFACKGYQWNTPWTTVRTYKVGNTYDMQLNGSATHGGGSCQLSLSFDGGKEFKVIKSMVGGCPETKRYKFTIPRQLNKALDGRRQQGLFAWTWFNRIGNREMYMNCAVVDIVPSTSHKRSPDLEARDSQRTNAAAQAAMAAFPDLFVANLKNVNDCVTKETQEVIFDNPGDSVDYGDGDSKASTTSFKRGECVGKGGSSAGSSSTSASSSGSSSGGSGAGDSGQWSGEGSSNKGTSECDVKSGMWCPDVFNKPSGEQTADGAVSQKQEQQSQHNDHGDDEVVSIRKKPSSKVEAQLDDYLEGLYDKKKSTRERSEAHVRAKGFEGAERIVLDHAQDIWLQASGKPDKKETQPSSSSSKSISKPSSKPTSKLESKPTSKPAPKLQSAKKPTPSKKPKGRPFPKPTPPGQVWRHWKTDKTTKEALEKEQEDIAGNDGPKEFEGLLHKPEFDSFQHSQPPRRHKHHSHVHVRCANTKRSTEPCSSPNRWVKRDACAWTCGRKGRSTTTSATQDTSFKKRASVIHPDTVSNPWGKSRAGPSVRPAPRPRPRPRPYLSRARKMQILERKLRILESSVSRLMRLIATKTRKPVKPRPQKARIFTRRQEEEGEDVPAEELAEGDEDGEDGEGEVEEEEPEAPSTSSVEIDADTEEEPVPTPSPAPFSPPPSIGPSTFDLFLAYLNRLDDKVIECIRWVAEGAGAKLPELPISRTFNSSDSVPAAVNKTNDEHDKHEKRQLVVPAVAGPFLYRYRSAFDSVETPSDEKRLQRRQDEDENEADMNEKYEILLNWIFAIDPAIDEAITEVQVELQDGLDPAQDGVITEVQADLEDNLDDPDLISSQEVQKRQLLVPGVNAPPLPALPHWALQDKTDFDYDHAYDPPPGKLGPKKEPTKEVKEILDAYRKGLGVNTASSSIAPTVTTRPPPPPPKDQAESNDGWIDGVFPRPAIPESSSPSASTTPDALPYRHHKPKPGRRPGRKPVSSPSTRTKSTTPTPRIGPAVLPFILGPGPLIPPGVKSEWPGDAEDSVDNLEKFPTVVNDLGPGSEEEVRKWFAEEARKQKEALGSG